jgi:AhpD family alkylhydroperoxidase
MKMDERTKKLIAVGASVGANCHPCLEHHVGKALEAGIDRDDLMEAVEVAKAVRKGAASSMDKLSLHLVRDTLPGTAAAGTCDCC